MNDVNEYSTKDLYLATTLLALEFPLLRIEKNGKIFYFIFDSEPQPDIGLIIRKGNWTPKEVVDYYWTDQLTISPKKLFTAFKEIKNRMYA